MAKQHGFDAFLAVVLLSLMPAAHCETQASLDQSYSSAAPRKVPPPPAKNNSSKPTWQELTPAQKKSLQPLGISWSGLSDDQKRKWIVIARNYPTITPAEQATMHARMTEWVSLSRTQRATARLNFAQSKGLTTSQKAQSWEEYQTLSPDEKKSLAQAAAPRPAGVALAIKPVPPQKLATIPANQLPPIKKQ